MDFETLYNITESSDDKNKLIDDNNNLLVEYQPYQTYRDQLNASIGNSASAYNRYNMSKLIDADKIAFSSHQYEELLSKAKNFLPWPIDKTPEEFKLVFDTLQDIKRQLSQSYSKNIMLNTEQKKIIAKDIKKIKKIQKVIFDMLDELGSFEK